jgi:hypothetical protein
MAPEQARGEEELLGPRADIFALGGVLYELLTGRPPFDGDSTLAQWDRARRCDLDREALRIKGIARGLERIVVKAMAAAPCDRYATADELAADLEAYIRRPRRLASQAGVLLLGVLPLVAWSRWPAPPPAPLTVEALEVEVHRRDPPAVLGPIGPDLPSAQLEDDVRVHARLSAPAFSYLIALNPDGREQLCYPKDPNAAPLRSTEIDYPVDPLRGFALTDGKGLQVFVLVTSHQPLPPYSVWRGQLKDLPWRSTVVEGVWRYDGHRFNSGTHLSRGGERRLADLPPELGSACLALQSGPGIEAIRAIAFPVQAREAVQLHEAHPGAR